MFIGTNRVNETWHRKEVHEDFLVNFISLFGVDNLHDLLEGSHVLLILVIKVKHLVEKLARLANVKVTLVAYVTQVVVLL